MQGGHPQNVGDSGGITKKPVDENSHTTLERFKGVMQLESLANVMRDTSLCGLGRSAPNPVISSLKHFREEFEEHIFDRNCQVKYL
jgi:NADH:ubiquinone oxidoreductase subunit F (NADH-binding)